MLINATQTMKDFQLNYSVNNGQKLYDMLLEIKDVTSEGFIPHNLVYPDSELDIRYFFEQFKNIRYKVLLYYTDGIIREKYYEILKRYLYNTSFEIEDAIQKIIEFRFFSDGFSGARINLLNSPFIAEIFMENDSFKIVSNELGSFNFYLLDDYFKKNNDNEVKRLLKENFSKNCHLYSELFLQTDQLYKALTFLKPGYLKGHYLHSCILDLESNMIVDLARGFVMDINEYFTLANPVVLNLLNKEEFENAIEENQDKFLSEDKAFDLVKLALVKKPQFFNIQK